jgi:hypothetical protein
MADIDCAEADRIANGAEADWYSISAAFGREAASADLSDPWRLLQTVFSFHLRAENADQPFRPWSESQHGRSAIPSDLSPANLDTLRVVAADCKNADLRARASDVLWVATKDYQFGERAVDAYLEAGRAIEDHAEWVASVERYTRASRIAKSLGKRSPLIARVREQVLTSVRASKGEDLLYFTARLIGLALFLDGNEYAELMGYALAGATRARTQQDFWRARTYYEVVLQLARKLKDMGAEKDANLAIAETWVEEAEAREKLGDYLASHSFWESAVLQYRKIGEKEKSEACRRRLKVAGLAARKHLKSVSTTIDLSRLAEAARQAMAGLNLQDSLCAFALLLPLPDPKEFRDAVMEQAKRAPLAHLVTRTSLAEDGSKVAVNPGMSLREDEEDEAAIQGHMINQAIHHYSMMTLGMVQPAWIEILKSYPIDEDVIAGFVSASAIVPPDRAEFFIKGITAGFRRDFVTALHFLMPQLEQMLRHVLRMHNVITKSIDDAGIEEEWPLGKLLSAPELKTLLGEANIFALKSMLIEKSGPNLRNLLLHGLLTPRACRSVIGVFFWYLMIQLVFFQTPQMQDLIRRRQEEHSRAGGAASDRGESAPDESGADESAAAKETFLYFAYGSNMSTPRLRERARSRRPIGIAALPRHQLRFHKRRKDGAAKCDAFRTEDPADVVHGVLFEIANDDKAALDRAEGLGHGYSDEEIEVIREDGEIVRCRAYIASPEAIDASLRPTAEYKQFVVDGAREHGLPEDYIARFITNVSIQ